MYTYARVNMDSTIQNLDSFFINGFYYGNIDRICQIDFDKYNFLHCNKVEGVVRPDLESELKTIIEETKVFLVENYISKVFTNYQFLDYYAWEGVDPGSSVWHNDKREGFNSNILVYLDDSLGCNTIEVKSDNEEFKMYPKKGDFIWLNQSTRFLHRATHIQGRRRVFSFEFNIDDLWN